MKDMEYMIIKLTVSIKLVGLACIGVVGLGLIRPILGLLGLSPPYSW